MRSRYFNKFALAAALGVCLSSAPISLWAKESQVLAVGQARATMALEREGELRTYELTTNADLRDNKPPEKRITFSEVPDHARIRTGNLLFDGLYAMAVSEAMANSVS